MKLEKILLTSDLSDESLRAFGPVAELARMSGAKIVLLHVVEDVPVVPYGAPLTGPLPTLDPAAMVAAAQEALERQARTLTGLAVEPIVVTSTSTAETIGDVAVERGVDMIALSSHGRTGLRRWVLGSVTEAVVRHARVPVLVFPPPTT
jgi:nucleotide-binding universal stress UspA family protein